VVVSQSLLMLMEGNIPEHPVEALVHDKERVVGLRDSITRKVAVDTVVEVARNIPEHPVEALVHDKERVVGLRDSITRKVAVDTVVEVARNIPEHPVEALVHDKERVVGLRDSITRKVAVDTVVVVARPPQTGTAFRSPSQAHPPGPTRSLSRSTTATLRNGSASSPWTGC